MSDERVTLRDIYAVVNRLEDKTNQRLDKLEDDVESIKGFQNKWIGILSVFMIFASAIANFVWEKVIGR